MNVRKRCGCAGNCDHPYQFRFKHLGTPYRESTHTKNYKLACLIADRRRREIIGEVAGVAPDEPITAKLSTLRTTYETWAAADHPATAAKDTRTLAGFTAVFPDDPFIVAITPFDIERWRIARAKVVQRTTVNREYNTVRGMFREAVTWYPGFTDPTAGIAEWETDDPEIVIPTDADVQVAQDGLPPDYWLMCRVTIECLPRISEVLGLTRHDIGTSPGPLYWLSRRLKGGKRMRVSIPPDLYTGLHARLTRPGQHYLFETQGKKGATLGKWVRREQEATSSYFTRMFAALGLAHLSHHSFRHLGVTLMLDRGVSGKAIQTLAGWTSMRMLERYGHLRDAEMQRAVDGNAAALATMLRRA